MNKLDVIRSWKKDHVPGVGKVLGGEPVRILPGYRLDFGDGPQLKFNFEGIEVREANPKLAVMYRRWM